MARTPKDVQQQALTWLESHIKLELPGAMFQKTPNKGRRKPQPDGPVADVILTYDRRKFHIEVKGCSKHIDHNLRFRHQTIGKAIGKDLLLAVVQHLSDPRKTSVTFARLGTFAHKVTVEPSFVLKASEVTGHKPSLGIKDLVFGDPKLLSLRSQLDSLVRTHVMFPSNENGAS